MDALLSYKCIYLAFCGRFGDEDDPFRWEPGLSQAMNNEREVTGGSEAVFNSAKGGFSDIFFLDLPPAPLEDKMRVSD